MGFGTLVLGPGSRLRVRGGRLLAQNPQGTLEVPDDVKLVVASSGRSSISVEALRKLCLRGAVLVWLGPRGALGSTQCWGNASRAAALQAACRASPRCRLVFAKRVLREKIRRQASLLRRLGLIGLAAHAVDTLRGLEDAETLDEALGYEGIAARTYWLGLRLAASVPRRTPRACDPWNKGLDLGYSLAAAIAYGVASAFGLIPQLGIIHTGGWGPGLAYDLVEPLRPLVDSVVLELWHSLVVAETSSGCILDRGSRARLLSALVKALARPSPIYPRGRGSVLAWYIDFIARKVIPVVTGGAR